MIISQFKFHFKLWDIAFDILFWTKEKSLTLKIRLNVNKFFAHCYYNFAKNIKINISIWK